MARSCPQHCGRMVTAAIFISFGVVQLIAGIILLKSKYVYLLSGPNIWTALSNVAGGGLLGLSAGVWEKISKTSPKHAIRRNILSALVASVFLLNVTTAIILILGEGNTLLSIQLEKKKNDSSAAYSASEILAYAYSASVCSPVVCAVVATVFLAEMIFPRVRKSFHFGKVLQKESNTFSWVYKTDLGLPKPDPEVVRRAMSSRSSWSSSSSDESPDVVRRKLDVETSLSKGISRLQRRPTVPFEPDPRIRSRVSFVGDYSTNDKMLQDVELGDMPNGMPPTRLKKRGDLFYLSYAREGKEIGTDLNASVSSRKSRSRLVHRVKNRQGRENLEDPDVEESLSSRKVSQSVPGEVRMYEISRYGPALDLNASISGRKISQRAEACRSVSEDHQSCERSGLGTAPDLEASSSSMKIPHQLVHRDRQPVPEDVQYYDSKMQIDDSYLDRSVSSRKFPRPVHETKGRQPVPYEGNGKAPDLNASRKASQPPEDVQYPDVFESFQETLRGHQSFRKTSTTTQLSQSRLEDGSFDHSNLHATLSGMSSIGRFDMSQGEDFFAGEVVPIRTGGTLPRLPSRLVPVAAPVVVSSDGFRSLRRLKTAKFIKEATVGGGTSSFKGGRGAKHRSKSTGAYPERPFEAIPREAVESSLQLSPAHTSGYMSSGDDNLEFPFGTSSDRPISPGCSSNTYSSKRRKFRSSRRKNHDQQLKLKAEEIDDVVKQMIIKEQILSDNTIEELYKMICYRRSLLSP